MKETARTASENRIEEAVSLMNLSEREAMLDALRLARRCGGLRESVEEAILKIALGRLRDFDRSRSDRRTDHTRRVLVGVRVPRERAKEYQASAAAQGVSLYRWVLDAFENHLRNETKVLQKQDVVEENE